MSVIKQLNKDIIKIIWHGLKTNRIQVVNNIITGLVLVGLDFLFVWLTKQTIDIATGAGGRIGFRLAVSFLILTMVMQLLLSAWRNWINAMLSVKATNNMQLDFIKHAVSMPWLKLQKYHSGDLVNRVEKDVNVIVGFVTDTLPNFIVVGAQFCGAFAFLYVMDSKLSLFVVIVIPFFLILGKLYIRKMRKITRRIRSVDSKLQSQYQEGFNNNIIIKSIPGSFGVVVDSIVSSQEHLVNLVKRRAVFSISSNVIVNTGFTTAYLFTFIWGTYHLSLGIITYGTLIAFIQLVAQIQRPARGLVKFVPEFINLLTSGERLLELKKITSEFASSKKCMSEPVLQANSGLGIRFDNVSFGYTPANKILNGISYDFRPSSRTVISGSTGRGKTTLVRMMLALFEPSEGAVVVYDNAKSIRASVETRNLFAYVPQGNTLFSGSIRENLKIANSEATDDELQRVLKIAQADFVFNLPLGLSSQCGEKGVTLSEGQAQRLCIARTLLVNAPILLLDEATSALDEETEAKLLDSVNKNYPHTTIIYISHRPKALEYCTGVLHLD